MEISKQTAIDIALAYREIETAEKLLEDIKKTRSKWDAPDIRDAFGRQQGGLQLGVPAGDSSRQLFNVEWAIAVPVIEQHIAAARAKITILTAKARAEIGPDTAMADLAALRQQHADWSTMQFGDVSAIGPAKHLSREALEVAAAPADAMEHADCWMLLWDMQRRAGISDATLAAAIQEKLAINMARDWPPAKEGEAREHIRGDDAQTALAACKAVQP